jgi:plastocyanin domain-containing protein
MFRTVTLALSLALATVVVVDASALAKPAAAKHAQERVIPIEVTSAGFLPAQIKTKSMEQIKLVVTRTTERTCAKDIVLRDFGISKPLPLNQPVEVTLTPTRPGQFRYACAMNMVAGVIIAE